MSPPVPRGVRWGASMVLLEAWTKRRTSGNPSYRLPVGAVGMKHILIWVKQSRYANSFSMVESAMVPATLTVPWQDTLAYTGAIVPLANANAQRQPRTWSLWSCKIGRSWGTHQPSGRYIRSPGFCVHSSGASSVAFNLIRANDAIGGSTFKINEYQ